MGLLHVLPEHRKTMRLIGRSAVLRHVRNRFEMRYCQRIRYVPDSEMKYGLATCPKSNWTPRTSTRPQLTNRAADKSNSAKLCPGPSELPYAMPSIPCSRNHSANTCVGA